MYQTFELINKSDTPCYFHILDDVHKTFRVYPTSGLIEAKAFFIVTCEF